MLSLTDSEGRVHDIQVKASKPRMQLDLGRVQNARGHPDRTAGTVARA